MYDSIKIVLSEKDLNNEISFMEEIPCRIVVSVCSENRVVGYLRNMRVEVRGTTLVVEGSLTKWVLGNNYAKPLGIWEIRSGVKALSVALGVPIEKAVVQRLDVAFNFRVKHMPWLYMRRLLYSDGFYSAHIKKETLYFSKHDCQMVFYDKIAEMKSCKRTDDIKQGLEDFEDLNVLRYEFRFKKVKSIFGRTIRGEDLYTTSFCLLVLKKWYDCYMDIQKTYDKDLSYCMFYSKMAFELACVAYCMNQFNVNDMLEEAFIRRDISSKNKYDIKEVLAKAKNVGIDSLNAASMIDELTSKIEHAYVKLRSRYDVAPERLERLNRWVDRGVTGMPS